MTSLRKIFVPALLAGSAVLAGCDSKDPRADLAGLTDSIAAACPTENKSTATKVECANVGKQHALTLVEYALSGDQFKKACTFRNIPAGTPDFAIPFITGTEASRCLAIVEGLAEDKVVKETARKINLTLRAGIL